MTGSVGHVGMNVRVQNMLSGSVLRIYIRMYDSIINTFMAELEIVFSWKNGGQDGTIFGFSCSCPLTGCLTSFAFVCGCV